MNIIKNIPSILNGIKTAIIFQFLSKDKKELIRKRRSICTNCIFSSDKAKKIGIYKSIRKDNHCTLCGCNIHLKTACLKCNCAIKENNNLKNIEAKW